jgi:hypothetical protein
MTLRESIQIGVASDETLDEMNEALTALQINTSPYLSDESEEEIVREIEKDEKENHADFINDESSESDYEPDSDEEWGEWPEPERLVTMSQSEMVEVILDMADTISSLKSQREELASKLNLEKEEVLRLELLLKEKFK